METIEYAVSQILTHLFQRYEQVPYHRLQEEEEEEKVQKFCVQHK